MIWHYTITSDPNTQPRLGKGRFCYHPFKCYHTPQQAPLDKCFLLREGSISVVFPLTLNSVLFQPLRQKKCFQHHFGSWTFAASLRHRGSFLKPVYSERIGYPHTSDGIHQRYYNRPVNLVLYK